MRYSYQNEVWQVMAPAVLLADVPELAGPSGELNPDRVAALHAAIEGSPRTLAVARALYGLHPVILAPDADPAQLRVRTRTELAAELGITRPQLQAEVAAVRGLLTHHDRQASTREAAKEPAKPAAPPAPAEDLFTAATQRGETVDPEALLAELGLAKMEFSDPSERQWFLERVVDWRKFLTHRIAGDLARQSLLTAREIRRLGAEVARLKVTDEQYGLYSRLLETKTKQYHEQLKALDELDPYQGLMARGQSFSGSMADVTKAIRAWHSDQDHHLVDGIFTASEVQILCRTSAQQPVPQYRADWVVALEAARAGLWDKNWAPTIPPETLRHIGQAWREAFMRASKENGAPPPDLLADGPAGEYPDQFGAGHEALPINQ
ncbi:MAG: hypothetical protein ACYC23_22635 [Limisphaerales bacterium]